MGILDEAIREHLDLKRRGGADEPELKRLEDEAFGPPGRPDPSGADAAIADALATPSGEAAVKTAAPPEHSAEGAEPNGAGAGSNDVSSGSAATETPPPDGPAPEAPPAPQPETGRDEASGELPEPSSADAGEAPQSGAPVFHDFAAEEGLVTPRMPEPAGEPEPQREPEATSPPESPSAEPETASEAPEPAPPEAEDTQVHDMAQELGLEESATPPPDSAKSGEAPQSGELELDEGDLELELEDDELELPGEEIQGDEPKSDQPPEGEDVLEETPEFLRDAPESDRMWFEQGKPKDFDFDEE